MAAKPMGERVATLEQQFKMIDARIEHMDKNIQEVRDVLLQAKGVRWVIAGTIGIVGMVLGGLQMWFAR